MADMLVKLYDLPELAPYIQQIKTQNITLRPALAPELHLVSKWVAKYFSLYWQSEVIKHQAAVIDGLGLKPDDVYSIKGCVIAGRSQNENKAHLKRHMSQPRTGIEFFTFDMLARSLLQIAKEI